MEKVLQLETYAKMCLKILLARSCNSANLNRVYFDDLTKTQLANAETMISKIAPAMRGL